MATVIIEENIFIPYVEELLYKHEKKEKEF